MEGRKAKHLQQNGGSALSTLDVESTSSKTSNQQPQQLSRTATKNKSRTGSSKHPIWNLVKKPFTSCTKGDRSNRELQANMNSDAVNNVKNSSKKNSKDKKIAVVPPPPPSSTSPSVANDSNVNAKEKKKQESEEEKSEARSDAAVAPNNTVDAAATTTEESQLPAAPVNPKFNFPPKSMTDCDWQRNIHLTDEAIDTNPTITDIQQWSFDPLLYKDTCLQSVFPEIIHYYNFETKYNLSNDMLYTFSAEIMKRHNDVIYHNWYHIISVLHITFMLLSKGGGSEYLQDRDIFAVLFSAFIHDVDHRGHNNNYENEIKSTLSQRYNEESVLENNSLDVTFDDILPKPNCNVLHGFDDQESMKNYIREIVLRTDVAKYHGPFVKKLKERKAEAEAEAEASGEPILYFDRGNDHHTELLCQAILKAADISNPAYNNIDVVKDWGLRISKEFKLQTDRERAQNLNFQAFMNVNDEYEVSKGQIPFYNFMALPYLKLIGEVLPRTEFLTAYALENLEYYKEYSSWVDTKRQEQKEQQAQE